MNPEIADLRAPTPCTPFILRRAFFQQRRRKKKQKHLGTHCLQLLRPDQDILHNIFCFASPWLFKFLCPGGWPVKDWTAHLASTSPSQLQTSRGNSPLSDSDRGEFLFRFELGLMTRHLVTSTCAGRGERAFLRAVFQGPLHCLFSAWLFKMWSAHLVEKAEKKDKARQAQAQEEGQGKADTSTRRRARQDRWKHKRVLHL